MLHLTSSTPAVLPTNQTKFALHSHMEIILLAEWLKKPPHTIWLCQSCNAAVFNCTLSAY